MIYRKHGQTVRWENGTVIRVTESGVAEEDGDLFTCAPASGEQRGAEAALPVPRAVFTTNYDSLIERLILTHGFAEHQYGDRTWSEHTQRLHVALTHNRERVLIDQAGFDTTPIERIAAALLNAGSEQAQPARLRLAANVTAALLPAMLELAPPNVRILQSAGGIDGKGQEIVEAAKDWPNWYRPSYRIRPVRAPLNLRIECSVTEVDRSRPIAIALLAPVTGLTLRVLIEDGPRVYPSTIRVTRIDAVSNERTWYPYGAGSFGAEMML
jgi:hypothetical protein